VNIDAYDTVSFDGQSSLHGDSRQSSGAFSAVKENGVGQGGSVNVKTGSLSLTNGAIVSASTLGRGNAGSVTINARDTVSFDGEGPNFSASSAYSEVASAAVGQGGSVNVTTGSLSVTNGAVLSASTYGRGDAGSVIINARDTASFDGEGRLHENYLHEDYRNTSAVYSQVTPSGMGNGGKVNVTTGSLYVTHGAALQASTRGQGNAGSVTINVRNTASFNGEGGSPNFFSSGAYTRFEKDAVGNGGDVSITAGSLSLTNGALIQANTLGKGSAGSVKIDVRDRASFDGVGPADSLPSGAYSQVEKDAVGNGGDINVTAGLLSLTNGAVLNASSDGQGNAGNIFASVHGTLQANNGTISTSATKFSGGAIDINARDIRLHGNSDIKTNVASGAGNGGNINLSARSIFAFDNSDILAYARDGRGGNITLKTPTFFGYRYLPTPRSTDPATLDHNNRVDINASGAFTGIITLPDSSFVQNSLTSLPTNVIDTSNLIANSCIARGRHQKGSFLITGAGGLPTRPDDPENAPFQTYVVPMVGVSSRQHSTVSSTSPARLWKLGDPIVEPQGVYRLPDGQLILSRECQRQQW